MEALTTAITSLTTIVSDCIGIVTGNSMLMVLFAVGFVSAGFSVFSMAKNAARG